MTAAMTHLKSIQRRKIHSTFSTSFLTKRLVDYERGEIKRANSAKQQKRTLHDLNHASRHQSVCAKKFKSNPSSKSTSKCLLSLPNTHSTLQSKRCDVICTETAAKRSKSKAKQTKTKNANSMTCTHTRRARPRRRDSQLEIERERVIRYQEMKFKRKRQNYITAMVHEMFGCDGSESERQCMKGRDKMVMESRIKSANEYKVSVKQLNIQRDKRKNNVIVGIQITDQKRTHTVYSNERGMIFVNKKYVKRGFKIKSKSEMIVTVQYREEEGSICVNFGYIKQGKVVEIERKPIVIANVKPFEYGVNVKVFVAQNENAKYGEYTIRKLATHGK